MNPSIRILPPAVAERIAAGEVIERPASVVKELVENALDAGATEVVVTLEDGGRSSIEVLDNGHGIDRDDLATALERHATSKLRDLADLDRILTLGFRGEALPSIAAVSDLSILSRPTSSAHAYELQAGRPGERAERNVKPEAVTFGHFLGGEHGTRIQARNIFSQVPARLKFLKSPSSEIAFTRELMERIALSRPEVGFRLIHGDRTVLSLRPQNEADRVRTLLSDGEDFPLLHVERSRGALKTRVYWLQGLSSPQMRKILQVVNGRTLRDRLLQQAILTPFRQTLLPGQFPAAAVFLELDPAHLDVNVHPTKTEVRFLESSAIFGAVSSAFESLIREHGMMGFAAGRATERELPGWKTPEGADPTSKSAWGARESTPAQASFYPTSSPALIARGASPLIADAAPPITPLGEELNAPTSPSASVHEQFTQSPYLGTIFQTYLLFDLGEDLGLVDQHAAHERIRFETLAKRLRGGEILPSQRLLTPEYAPFDRDRRGDLESRLPWLQSLGFEAELFAEDRLLFRAVPAEWGNFNLKMRLHNLVQRLLEADTPTGDWALDEALFEKLASEACHSSVRAGDRLERAEALALVASLFATRHPWNCPHGRPTLARVPRGRFEEWFQRRVPG